VKPGWLMAHRGPFLLCVTRPHPKATRAAKGFSSTEWLKGEVAKDDLMAEAAAILADPRDTVVNVFAWSVKDQQFAGGFRK
jgi:hypothetical protein